MSLMSWAFGENVFRPKDCVSVDREPRRLATAVAVVAFAITRGLGPDGKDRRAHFLYPK